MKTIIVYSLLLFFSADLDRHNFPDTPAIAYPLDSPVIHEWDVPWENTRPRDPYVAPDGSVWFVGQQGNYLGRLTPSTGEFTHFELDEGTGPHNLIVDDDGMVWYAGNHANHIGVLNPSNGKIEKMVMPDEAARDPHTLVFDHNGDIWFTVQWGNYVGKLDCISREVFLIKVPTERARPYGIAVDSNNRPWFNLFGTNKIGTVDPETMELKEIVLPRTGARSRRIAVTPDDRIWYVDYAEGYIGVLDQSTGEVREWQMPGGSDGKPYAMAVDIRGRIWVVESGIDPNRFVVFDPATEEFSGMAEIPSGGGTVRHMVYHQEKDQIWFGTDTNTIGVAQLE
jgi:virginiamycin B lyase